MNAHPYESVYLDPFGMLNAPTSGAVLDHYQQHRFDPPAARAVGAPDHLGLELDFMAHLVDRALAAERIGHSAVVASLHADQRHALEQHLARWVPLFGVTLSAVAATPLYRTFGEVLVEFVLADLQALASAALA